MISKVHNAQKVIMNYIGILGLGMKIICYDKNKLFDIENFFFIKYNKFFIQIKINIITYIII